VKHGARSERFRGLSMEALEREQGRYRERVEVEKKVKG